MPPDGCGRPEPPRESRIALARVYRELAAQVADLRAAAGHQGTPAPDDGGAGAEAGVRLAESILAAERAIAAGSWRPDGLAGPHKARMYMLQGARRTAGLLEVFHGLSRPDVSGLERVTSQLLDEVASQLEECAAGVATYGRVLPEPNRIEQVRERFTVAGHRRFADQLAAGQGSDQLRTFAAWYFVLQQLCWGASLAAIHCRAMHDAPLEASVRSEQSALVKTLADGPSVAKWIRRARRNLSLRSVHFQNSLRLAAGLALARLAVGVLGLQHGFWVGFATLVVLKTSAAGTRSTAVQAAVGTAIGFAVSSALVTTLGVHALDLLDPAAHRGLRCLLPAGGGQLRRRSGLLHPGHRDVVQPVETGRLDRGFDTDRGRPGRGGDRSGHWHGHLAPGGLLGALRGGRSALHRRWGLRRGNGEPGARSVARR